jgi:hypothetical protein
LAITPSGDKIYVPTQGADLSVITTATDAVTTVTVGASSLYGATVTQTTSGLRVFVTDEFGEVVYVVDAATDTLLTGTGLPITDAGFSTPRSIASAISLAVPPPSLPVPTLNEWALLLMGLLIVGSAFVVQRRAARR